MCDSSDGEICDEVNVEESGGGVSVAAVAAIAIVMVILICLLGKSKITLLWQGQNHS